MILLEKLGGCFAVFWRFVAGPGREDFSCGECERRDRCGLPPREHCVTRAAQIEEQRRRRLRL